jgi:hypothetical protein
MKNVCIIHDYYQTTLSGEVALEEAMALSREKLRNEQMLLLTTNSV